MHLAVVVVVTMVLAAHLVPWFVVPALSLAIGFAFAGMTFLAHETLHAAVRNRRVVGLRPRFSDGTALAWDARMSLQARARSWRPLPKRERLRCVVVESGSGPLTQADGYDETIVVAQMRDEPPLAFAQRVIDRIVATERSGRRFESATVLAGDHRDRAAKAARRVMVLALSAHARARGGMSELTLASVGQAQSERSAELFELAEELMVLPNADSVPVRVRFGAGFAQASRSSGIFPAFGVKR